MTTERAQAEIRARFDQLDADGNDFFGFRREALLEAMEFETAADLIDETATADEWGAPDVKKTATAYLEFAIGKAAGHRGISAERSIEKLGEWLWCLGDKETARRFEAAEYPQYGVPKLELLARAWDVEHSERDTKAWQRMASGKPCSPECSGCGS